LRIDERQGAITKLSNEMPKTLPRDSVTAITR
jgi:hypothetical protein